MKLLPYEPILTIYQPMLTIHFIHGSSPQSSGLLRPLVATTGREDQSLGEGPGEGWKARWQAGKSMSFQRRF